MQCLAGLSSRGPDCVLAPSGWGRRSRKGKSIVKYMLILVSSYQDPEEPIVISLPLRSWFVSSRVRVILGAQCWCLLLACWIFNSCSIRSALASGNLCFGTIHTLHPCHHFSGQGGHILAHYIKIGQWNIIFYLHYVRAELPSPDDQDQLVWLVWWLLFLPAGLLMCLLCQHWKKLADIC